MGERGLRRGLRAPGERLPKKVTPGRRALHEDGNMLILQ
jgi:hypothetical protein